jgi:hypothetical protein
MNFSNREYIEGPCTINARPECCCHVGPQGQRGKMGLRGPRGWTGERSIIPGPTGPHSTMPGPTGPKSTVPGPTGAASMVPGPTGPASFIPGPTGPMSNIPGPTGPISTIPGPTGSPGPASIIPGPTGAAGASSPSESRFIIKISNQTLTSSVSLQAVTSGVQLANPLAWGNWALMSCTDDTKTISSINCTIVSGGVTFTMTPSSGIITKTFISTPSYADTVTVGTATSTFPNNEATMTWDPSIQGSVIAQGSIFYVTVRWA